MTNDTLWPGRNATVDHILPRSRGGRDEIGNLQWVTRVANQLKGDRTQPECEALCRAILDNAALKIAREVDEHERRRGSRTRYDARSRRPRRAA